jgi:nucleotide-binding universal stress UspA family protein
MGCAEMSTRILVCTNGFEGSWPAIEYAAWAAGTLETELVLLGIVEEAAQDAHVEMPHLEGLLQRAVTLFEQRKIAYSVQHESGRAEDVIPRFAVGQDFITALGPLGRPRLQRFFLGRSIRGLLDAIATPILYVPRASLPLKRILICLGGLGYEITAEHLAVRLGVATRADATLLHVAPPVDLDYPTARAEKEHWRDLAHTDTLPGRNLRRALEGTQSAGLNAHLAMRQGNVVEEILAEIKTGGYDLVCMGSGHGGHALRHLYEANVTDEVAEQVECPLLTARHSAPSERLDASPKAQP